MHRTAQLHDIDVLRLVEQHAQPQERRDDVQVVPLAHLDLFGEGVDRGSRCDDDRIVVVEYLHGTLRDEALRIAVDIILDVHVEVGDMGIGGTGAAVHLVKQPLALQDFHILADSHFRNPQFVRHVGDAHETVLVQFVEDIFVSFGNAQHISLSF